MKTIGPTKAVWLFEPKGIAKNVDAGALKSKGGGSRRERVPIRNGEGGGIDNSANKLRAIASTLEVNTDFAPCFRSDVMGRICSAMFGRNVR